jgi:hypothetical protein
MRQQGVTSVEDTFVLAGLPGAGECQKSDHNGKKFDITGFPTEPDKDEGPATWDRTRHTVVMEVRLPPEKLAQSCRKPCGK